MPPPPVGIPQPKPNAALGKPGSPSYNAAYGAAEQRYQNSILTNPGQAALYGLPAEPAGARQIGPGTWLQPGVQVHSAADVLAGNVPGVGAQIVGGSPGTPAEYAYLGLPMPTQQTTNLGAYSVQPDQFSSPPISPDLSYLGLPNYGDLGTGGYNATNPFQGLFGAQTDNTEFLSGWT